MGKETGYVIAGEERKYDRTRKKVLISIVTVLILCVVVAIVLLVVLTNANKRSSDKDQITSASELKALTSCGPVHGFIEKWEGKEALVFKGIPYAKPPVGKRRWKAPEKLEKSIGDGQCWAGTLNATKTGAICAQPYVDPNNERGNKQYLSGSEDCLNLNIWVPKRKDKKLLPVLVWIHGGTLLFGSNDIQGYTPNVDTVHSLDVVAVSINYRLNAFGFLSLDVLSRNSSTNSSGNYGLMDQIEALTWIQSNIKAFRGDPNLVTIMGHSGGGKAVYSLIASPLAKGLFHRAIPMSAPPVFIKDFKEASKDNAVFIKRANCTSTKNLETLQCLYNLTPLQVIQAIPWSVYPYWGISYGRELPIKDLLIPTFVVIDPVVMPVSPLDLANKQNPEVEAVPVLVTIMKEESENPAFRNISTLNLDEIADRIAKRLGTFSSNLVNDTIEMYFVGNQPNYGLAYIDMTSDVRAICPSNHMIKQLAAMKGSRVYQLAVENSPNHTVNYFGSTYKYAFHGWDSFALFNFHVKNKGKSKGTYNPARRDLRFKEDLQREIAHFIKHGTPRRLDWKVYPNNLAILKNSGLVVGKADYRESYCKHWNTKQFFKYGWVL